MKDNEKLVEVLGKLSGQLEELSEIIDPSVTVYRTVDKGSKAAEALAWFEGAAALAKPKWRAMVDEVELIDRQPYGLAFVLSELSHLAERPGSVLCLAQIIAVCEKHLEGKKLCSISPGAADLAMFSAWELSRRFTRDAERPDDYAWHRLGRNAAGWLDKVLTEEP